MDVDQATALKCAQRGNSSANVLSLLISQNYITPDQTVCCAEQSQLVRPNGKYEYPTPPPSAGASVVRSTQWDWDFSCDVAGSEKSARTGQWFSNVSYASLAPTTERINRRWTDFVDPGFVVLADRGPRSGLAGIGSASELNHGSVDEWTGNLMYADGHGDRFSQRREMALAFVLPGMEKSINGKPDNIFAEDDPDTGSDIYLSVWGDCIDGNLQALWD